MTVDEVNTCLDILIWDRNIQARTQPLIATNGHGLFEGLAWLHHALTVSDIKNKYKESEREKEYEIKVSLN